LLLLLANYGKEGKMESVIPNISQGTTRPQISYFMNKFRKLGLHRI
jgi:CRP/FNR family transcriptional regulator, cyclic AMP receptor protein